MWPERATEPEACPNPKPSPMAQARKQNGWWPPSSPVTMRVYSAGEHFSHAIMRLRRPIVSHDAQAISIIITGSGAGLRRERLVISERWPITTETASSDGARSGDCSTYRCDGRVCHRSLSPSSRHPVRPSGHHSATIRGASGDRHGMAARLVSDHGPLVKRSWRIVGWHRQMHALNLWPAGNFDAASRRMRPQAL